MCLIWLLFLSQMVAVANSRRRPFVSLVLRVLVADSYDVSVLEDVTSLSEDSRCSDLDPVAL